MSAHKLAQLVGSDLVLMAELLRTVNSAFFGMSRKIHTAVHAVALLGNRALRNLALCLAVRDSVRPDAIKGLRLVSFWEDALRRAVGARYLGQAIRFDPDEAFVIGLLQDFGLLAMMYAVPEHAGRYEKLRAMLPEERRNLEQEIFGITHDQVGLMLSQKWALPNGLAVPIASHHTGEFDTVEPKLRVPCRLAHVSDWIAAVYSADDKRTALNRCRALIQQNFRLTSAAIDDILERVPVGVEEAASSLGLRVQSQPVLDNVMRQANKRLVEENLSYQELTWRLERALAEKDKLAAQLREANSQLETLVYFDMLTGLVNHRRFHDALPAEIARHSRNGRPLTRIILALDLFKNVNDTYGHPFGDRVLQEVGSVIRATMRATDVKARVGGEEMCILLPETSAVAGQESAERLRKAIEALDIQAPTRRVHISASFGGSTWTGRANDSDAAMLVGRKLRDAADSALYVSKRKGRNRVTWKKFK
jgi:diguanylate cyclase (GGDEF)-like protein